MDRDPVINNARVATATNVLSCDIGIINGRISALGDNLISAGDTIDAQGQLALPGGIDSHVHLAQPGGPDIVMADDFESGTRAAAFGGNTAVLLYCLQQNGQTPLETPQGYHAKAEGCSHTDVSFRTIISDPTPSVLGQDLPAPVAEGYTVVKVFMIYGDFVLSDRELLEVMAAARRTGAMVMVHAEGHDTIRFLADQLEWDGRTRLRFHRASRPIAIEREATHRAVGLAEITDVPIVIVHVSCRAAMEKIARAQAREQKLFWNICPQYLGRIENDMERPGMEGGKYVCCPPGDAANQEICWHGRTQRVFSLFSSDHYPFRYNETDKLTPKANTSFCWIPNSIPWIEAGFPILFFESASKGRLSFTDFVALTSTNHAKMYGLYPRKDSIAIGADVDNVLWGSYKKETISQSDLHHGHDDTPYKGIEVTGWPVLVMLRETDVVQDAELRGTNPAGQNLERERAQHSAQPPII